MKTCLLSILGLILFILPCAAQDTTYSREIEIRKQMVQRLHERIKEWENRKTVLIKTENEYGQCMNAKSRIDQKVDEMRRTDREQQRPARVFNRDYQREKDHLTNILELTVAMGRKNVTSYRDLERWIAVYEKERPKNQRELGNLEKDLQKAWADLERIEKEIVLLSNQRAVVAGKAALEGNWLLPGGGGNNIVNVHYNEKDRHFYGTVTQSFNLTCHPPGTILFSVMPVSGADARFQGMEYGYDYDPATGKCRPQQARLNIGVSETIMKYSNGNQQLILHRIKEAPRQTLPMHRPGQDRP